MTISPSTRVHSALLSVPTLQVQLQVQVQVQLQVQLQLQIQVAVGEALFRREGAHVPMRCVLRCRTNRSPTDHSLTSFFLVLVPPIRRHRRSDTRSRLLPLSGPVD